MSEPMTSGEIEDVLSSIRKLVSEDLRPQPRGQVRAAAPAEPEKLLLTPALRVVEGNAEAEATLAASAPPEPDPARRLRLDTVVTSFAAQVNPPSGGWESETGDPTVTRLVRTTPPKAGRDDPIEAFPDAAAEDDTGEGRGITDAETVDSLPAGRLHFAWQAPSPGADREDGTAGHEPAPEAEVLHGQDKEGEAPFLDLDADSLADLVREILREELQGPLGERMTRNIRKLVRAEVARVIATRDLG